MARPGKRFGTARTLISLVLLAATGLVAGCVAYPAAPGYGYGYGPGYYPYGYYPTGGVVVAGGGWHGDGGWHGGGGGWHGEHGGWDH